MYICAVAWKNSKTEETICEWPCYNWWKQTHVSLLWHVDTVFFYSASVFVLDRSSEAGDGAVAHMLESLSAAHLEQARLINLHTLTPRICVKKESSGNIQTHCRGFLRGINHKGKPKVSERSRYGKAFKDFNRQTRVTFLTDPTEAP